MSGSDKRDDGKTQDSSPSDETLARRKAIKGLMAGGGIAGLGGSDWLKPVVNTVVLPGHAQTSPRDGGGNGGGTTTIMTTPMFTGTSTTTTTTTTTTTSTTTL